MLWKSYIGRYVTPTFQLHDLDWEILLPHTEDLQIAEDGFLRFGMAIDLDAQEVTLVLPVELALRIARSVTTSAMRT